MSDAFFKYVRTTSFRISSILITFLFLSIILIYQHMRFSSSDVAPKLEQVDEKTKHLATNVTVGCHIFNFPGISFKDASFLVDAIVWFKFPTASTDLNVIDQFSIQNSFVQRGGKLLFRSAPIIKIVGKEVLVSYHVQTTFTGEFQYKNFPIGDHVLYLTIQNRSVTPEEICFQAKSENISFAQKTFQSWSAKGVTASSGFIRAKLDHTQTNLDITYPVAVFAINFEQDGFNHIFSLYFPLFILFFIALFSLFFEIEDTQRIANIVSLVPSLVLFKLVINSASPPVGYLTHIDFLFYALVLLSLGIMIFQMYATLALQKAKKSPTEEQEELKTSLRKKNDILFIANLVALIVFILWLLVR